MKKINSKSAGEFKWNKRPSELKGFETACYLNHVSGDYLRLDYSAVENRSRFYLEIKGQSSDSYSIEIISGEISERSSYGKSRPSEVDQIFADRIKIFNSAPLKKPLKEIRKVLNIKELPVKEKIKPAVLLPAEKFSINRLLVKYKIADIFDFIAGIILSLSAFYFFSRSYSSAGAVSALFGIAIGALDMIVRHRKPVFSKILIFLISGLVLYVYGLMY